MLKKKKHDFLFLFISCYLVVFKSPAAPFARTSVGLDLTSAMLGSEGCLGIITSVVVRVVPVPEVSEHGSCFFRNFSVRYLLVAYNTGRNDLNVFFSFFPGFSKEHVGVFLTLRNFCTN